nr:Bicarbonate transport ATP-binding protein CmpC [Klebsiella pneumoniae]
MKPLIQVQAVSQRFNTASGEFLALQNVSFDIVEGETISLIGHSGCGKSTLLNLIAGITTLPRADYCVITGNRRSRAGAGGGFPEPLAAAVAELFRQCGAGGGSGVPSHHEQE